MNLQFKWKPRTHFNSLYLKRENYFCCANWISNTITHVSNSSHLPSPLSFKTFRSPHCLVDWQARCLLSCCFQLASAMLQYAGRSVRKSDLFGQAKTPLSLTRRFFKGLKVRPNISSVIFASHIKLIIKRDMGIIFILKFIAKNLKVFCNLFIEVDSQHKVKMILSKAN